MPGRCALPSSLSRVYASALAYRLPTKNQTAVPVSLRARGSGHECGLAQSLDDGGVGHAAASHICQLCTCANHAPPSYVRCTTAAIPAHTSPARCAPPAGSGVVYFRPSDQVLDRFANPVAWTAQPRPAEVADAPPANPPVRVEPVISPRQFFDTEGIRPRRVCAGQSAASQQRRRPGSARKTPAGSPRHADSTQRPARALSQVIYSTAMGAQASKRRQTPST